MKIKIGKKILFSLLPLISGVANSSLVEISFEGLLTNNWVYEEAYGVTYDPYVPEGFESETAFHGVLRYDDKTPLNASGAQIGSIYYGAEFEIVIGGAYTLRNTYTGQITARNNYASSFDYLRFDFGGFPNNDFINPDSGMTSHSGAMRFTFYDDDLSVLDEGESLPSANQIAHFDRFYLDNLTVSSEAQCFYVDDPYVVEGYRQVCPSQGFYMTGNITSATGSPVPLPLPLYLLITGMFALFCTKSVAHGKTLILGKGS